MTGNWKLEIGKWKLEIRPSEPHAPKNNRRSKCGAEAGLDRKN